MKSSSSIFIILGTLSSCNALMSQKQLLTSDVSIKAKTLKPKSLSVLNMAPRIDRLEGRWSPDPSKPEEGIPAYGPVGSLIRGGPLPFIQRIFKADDYEQAVYKYMANEGCDRKEAQGNMDAYLENPNDWAYQKMQEKKGGFKRDYANVNTKPKDVILSGAWALIVFWFFATFISDCVAGKYVVENTNTLANGNLWTIPFLK
mmetsp:Transcript_12795/g.12900  ORF Transcript_12795/g.12900 Transcript_12795/m.12900 type:complete len:202 (-) Transcript_12795:234-839(-)